jgi:bifunctional DNA-binding transcriptional regulator/antitoxin component of YhaV-PrlF toxin-antitoxin module
MGAIGRVQARGQVTLPRELREATGIEAGAELVFFPLGPGRFEARVVPARRSVRDLLATYATDATAPTPQAITAAIEDGLVHEAMLRQRRREATNG